METASSAAFSSWTFDWTAIIALTLTLGLYLRGWLYGRTLLRDERDGPRLAFFAGGLAIVFLAVASPLDAFDSLFLSVHMTQHLLLMMLAPPLILLGRPFLPLLRGLPKTFVVEGIAPFLAWPALKRVAACVTAPPLTWTVFAINTILWHVPKFYELALQSAFWHGMQHACFFWSGILFWWPVIEGNSKWPTWAFIPYLLVADFINTGISAYFVFSNQVLYPTYDLVRATSLKATDDQVLAGVIMWVPGSLVYLVPAFILAMRVFAGTPRQMAVKFERVRDRREGKRWLPEVAQHRRWLQAGLLVVAIVVMADGWFGKQVAPVNLAGTMPWIYWRGLSILALLTVGNLFCMSCPFILVRDLGRKVLPANRKWPRMLRNKWTACAVFTAYLWVYEAFALWDSPWMTAWLIAGYFLGALVIDGVFRGASFCKYVCPIGQYHFVISALSPREIAWKSPEVCKSCKTFDCIKGNATARGCELDLFVPKKVGNFDCTLCLDCVKACPHDNIVLKSVMPGVTLLNNAYRSSIGRLAKRWDWVALILLITFGAFVNAGGMADPVMMWEHRWHARLGMHAMPWIVGAVNLMGMVVAPVVLVGLAAVLTLGMKAVDAARKFGILLTPLGVGMWAAHAAYHALAFYVSNVTPVEILLMDAGALATLFLIWREARGSFRLATPWAALTLGLYAAGLWILFQPMQMRGMM